VSDVTMLDLAACLKTWEPDARVVGNVRAGDILKALTTLAAERDAATRALRDARRLTPDKLWRAVNAYCGSTGPVAPSMRAALLAAGFQEVDIG